MEDDDRVEASFDSFDPTASSDERARDGDDSTNDGEWPVAISGVVESLVTTRGPNDRWNMAPLGLFGGSPVTATTWGTTRTRRNFERTGLGYVQFSTDPIVFVDAALSIVEFDDPVFDGADAWVRVEPTAIELGSEHGTEWVRWRLDPDSASVRNRRVPTISRAFGAVVEASVAASRLDLPQYDAECGLAIIERAGAIVDRTGNSRTRRAYERLRARVDERDDEC
ncbi:DUF447 domain-containing protein [Halovivax gelatinilyticus]|uniref:DUF447 domain-containing protein n=1 Tax=Halovivax gelatinilyticus TaxID=2961597 RepID=UPI003CCDE286